MTNEQRLKLAMEKAVKNGWDIDLDKSFPISVDWDAHTGKWILSDGMSLGERFYFSPSFAKAFWGKTKTVKQVNPIGGVIESEAEPWAYHLQQMVLEKDRIKYLEKFLEKRGGENK